VSLNGWDQLTRRARRREARQDETLQGEGDKASIAGLVLAGVLRLVKTLPDGRQQIVDLVYPGQFFGHAPGAIADCAIEAATDAELGAIDRSALESVMQKFPEVEHRLFAVALEELARSRTRSLLLGCLSTQERIASFLLIALMRRERVLRGVAGPGHKRIAVLQVTRHDLARYLSTSIETISRTLHLFANEAAIRLIDHDHFEIIDYDVLVERSGLTEEDLATFDRSSDLCT
jgi:CRP/FNR family transcriptional regulator